MRPRNAAATRDLIVTHARRSFAQHGFAASTVKGIADEAGVSPNLITRYFGGKAGLFVAATQVRIPVADTTAGSRTGMGARPAAGIVRRWSGVDGDDPLLVLQRAAGERPQAAEALSEFLDANALEPLERSLIDSGLDAPTARDRAAAVDAFVLGVSTRRRILRDDLGDPREIEAWLAATIQRLIDG